MHFLLTSLLHFPLSDWHPAPPAPPRRRSAAISEEEMIPLSPSRPTQPESPPPSDPCDQWRNPPRLLRVAVTGFVCAMPGALLAAHLGLWLGRLELLTFAGGLIGFLIGTTLELAPGSIPGDRPPQPRSPDETGPRP